MANSNLPMEVAPITKSADGLAVLLKETVFTGNCGLGRDHQLPPAILNTLRNSVGKYDPTIGDALDWYN